jgi:ABC-type oligopeptide transport system ATPase subunit
VSNKIIAICGPSGSGKSTLAKLIQKNEGGVVVSFAEPIKKMLSAFVESQGCDPNTAYLMFYDSLKNTPSTYLSYRTPVYAMRTLGTEWGRDLMHTDLWVNAWKNKVATIRLCDVIVDDLRFLSEEKTIRAFEKSVIIKVSREEIQTGKHRSEKEYTKVHQDIMIYNDSTPEDMYATYRSRS